MLTLPKKICENLATLLPPSEAKVKGVWHFFRLNDMDYQKILNDARITPALDAN
jgi:hypothetical protein